MEQSSLSSSSLSSVKRNIVVVPLNAVGHVNGCRGATINSLISRGHRVYFILEKSFEGQLKPYGFEEVIYEIPHDDNDKMAKTKPGEQMAHDLLSYKILGKMTVEEKLRHMFEYFLRSTTFYSYYEQVDKCLKKLMQEINVDLFIIDDAYPHPAIYYSNVPLIRCVTSAPFIFFAGDPKLPPPFTGLPSNSDPKVMKRYHDILEELLKINAFSDHIEKLGYEIYPKDRKFIEDRIEFTIYACPKELNHWKIESAHPKWFNMEVFNKNLNDETINLKRMVGSKFFLDDLDGRFSGKLIYVSMGSMGSVDLYLMQRLIETLSCTNHKYIISKGPRHQEYKLARNMWGARFLPQVKILPLVDLVITHGGNNTITETFVQGKPMIVMPLFCDQFDNAQRLVETNFGLRIDPYDFDKQELLDSIEKLLYDEQLKDRLRQASERIKKSQAHQIFGEMVEEVINGSFHL